MAEADDDAGGRMSWGSEKDAGLISACSSAKNRDQYFPLITYDGVAGPDSSRNAAPPPIHWVTTST